MADAPDPAHLLSRFVAFHRRQILNGAGAPSELLEETRQLLATLRPERPCIACRSGQDPIERDDQQRVCPSCLYEWEECRKRGPYLPVGDTDWKCLTHDVELVRVAGAWGTPARREEMACPVAEPERAYDEERETAGQG